MRWIYFLLMIIIVDALCVCSLLFHVSLDDVILMILCLFARVAHYTYIQIHRQNYVKTELLSSFAQFVLCPFLSPSAVLSLSLVLSFPLFISIPIENSGDGDVECNRIWRRCRRRRSDD